MSRDGKIRFINIPFMPMFTFYPSFNELYRKVDMLSSLVI